MNETKTRTRNVLSAVEKDLYLKISLSMLMSGVERTDVITVLSERRNIPRSSTTNLVNEANALFLQNLRNSYDPKTDTVKGPLPSASATLDSYRRKPADDGDPFAGFFVDLPCVNSGPSLVDDDAPLNAEAAEEAYVEASQELAEEAAAQAPEEQAEPAHAVDAEPSDGGESPAPAEAHSVSRKGRKSR